MVPSSISTFDCCIMSDGFLFWLLIFIVRTCILCAFCGSGSRARKCDGRMKGSTAASSRKDCFRSRVVRAIVKTIMRMGLCIFSPSDFRFSLTIRTDDTVRDTRASAVWVLWRKSAKGFTNRILCDGASLRIYSEYSYEIEPWFGTVASTLSLDVHSSNFFVPNSILDSFCARWDGAMKVLLRCPK